MGPTDGCAVQVVRNDVQRHTASPQNCTRAELLVVTDGTVHETRQAFLCTPEGKQHTT